MIETSFKRFLLAQSFPLDYLFLKLQMLYNSWELNGVVTTFMALDAIVHLWFLQVAARPYGHIAETGPLPSLR